MTDKFVKPELDPRTVAPGEGDERDTLLGFLRWHRETLRLKCAGLDPEQLASRAVPPSTMSLLGLVRHLAEVERGWFRRGLSGSDAPRLYCTEAAPDADFDGAVAEPDCVAEAWRSWEAEAEFADRLIAEAPSLEAVSMPNRHRPGRLTLRWVAFHMIEEYARHNGHADLLRERLDGRVGQ
ncbi:DinB family protein [Glycomyces sp. A-F 0318]|uniref:DinB family protein n=1 Tax=Glycomyces amatae TaxID=2881355 RepID=UPI001E520F53|nr:DinB family protein [Glycomyces amatae]MCD0442818.1 DinB family protein [Glycomyces amatae]